MAERTLPIDMVQAVVSVALRMGWDVNALLEEAGVSPLLMAEGRARVTEEQLVRTLRSLWDRTDDELLGLGPHPLPRGTFRLLLFGIAGARDLGDALARLQGFVRAFPALGFDLDVADGEARLRAPTVLDDDMATIALLTGLAAGHRLICWAVGAAVVARRVELPFPRAHDETLAMMFDAPLVFDADRAALVFDADLLKRPFVRTDAEIEEMVAHAPRWFLERPRREVTLSA
ncbi:MAG TPA: AraC family transcriptional regulator ligand-binding domain-containing protein [Acidimicrobiales bacterium]|nr:AraC family transcriptional regulator ligand-binding domain-containing protein [Acidimicrobiales bacterium]